MLNKYPFLENKDAGALARAIVGPIEMKPYLSKLCESLSTSMIGDYRPTTLKVSSDGGGVTSREAVSLGLIVTELVLSALKHAFPDDKADRQIAVGFDVAGTNWRLGGMGTFQKAGADQVKRCVPVSRKSASLWRALYGPRR